MKDTLLHDRKWVRRYELVDVNSISHHIGRLVDKVVN